MKEKQKNKKYVILVVITGAFLLLVCIFAILCLYFMSPVGGNKNVSFIVNKGDSTRDIANSLEKKGLIKSSDFFTYYAIITNHRGIYAAKYELNTNMKLSEILDTFDKGGKNIEEITLTFKEGVNIRDIAKIISKNTNNSYEDVLSVAKDKDYTLELSKKYWFIDKNITKKKVYYYLEGYLFPDTYNFSSKNITAKEIFNDMIENTNKKLEKYKSSFEKNKYSVNELLTLASVVELEVAEKDSRKDVAGLFYNRLKVGMPLGSDATSYYGVEKNMTKEISNSDLNAINNYNTRVDALAGKLPVGPICNSSISSIEAVLSPSKHDYYYFVTDKDGKVYLTKNFEMHNKVINDLKNKGLWLEW